MMESSLSVALLVVADPIPDLFDSSVPFTPRERRVELAFDRRLDLAESPTRVFFSLKPFRSVRQEIETEHRQNQMTDQRPVIANLEMIQTDFPPFPS